MDIAQYMTETQQRLVADGNAVGPVTLTSGTALVGYQSKFKAKWAATKLHLFTVVVSADEATAAGLSQLTDEALDYAKQTKGQMRGLQSGVAVIPAIVANHVGPQAKAAAEARPAMGFAALKLPAIVDLGAGQTYWYQGRIIVGAFYAHFMREHLRAVLPTPPPPPPPAPPGA